MPIDGKKIAKDILDKLKSLPKPKKIFAAFLIGENTASFGFLKIKEKIAKELGVDFRLYKLPGDITNDKARGEVRKIAESKSTGGVIIQLPVPEQLNRHYILNIVPREKDIDVLGERSLGAFYAGRNPVLPPAVGTLHEILTTNDLQLTTMRVAVVGLGLLIGKPIANYLMGKTKELYLLDEGSNLDILKEVDLIVCGVGRAGLIKPEMLKNGASVVDFGYGLSPGGKVLGDFDASSLVNSQLLDVKSKIPLAFFTPTPGGTGPILVAKLFENFYTLNSQKTSK